MAKKEISKIAQSVWRAIERLNESQLKALIGECENLTETNCWFLDYQMKDIVSNLAVERLRAFPPLDKKRKRIKAPKG